MRAQGTSNGLYQTFPSRLKSSHLPSSFIYKGSFHTLGGVLKPVTPLIPLFLAYLNCHKFQIPTQYHLVSKCHCTMFNRIPELIPVYVLQNPTSVNASLRAIKTRCEIRRMCCPLQMPLWFLQLRALEVVTRENKTH